MLDWTGCGGFRLLRIQWYMDNVATLFRTQLLDRRGRLEAAHAAHPQAGHLSRLLDEVDAALERMDQGTYGLCEFCHEPVEAARLMADPLTRFCIDHLNAQQQEALQQDLDLAVRIQASLLPRRNLRADGWEACYHYEPAGPVSGDYCDLVASDSGGLFFITGDVSGKGVASSLLMSHLHAIFRSLLSVGMPIGALLERANRVFCESTLPSFYATLVCGRADPSGEVEICNAGHCPPLLVSRKGAAEIEATALPLGLFCSGEYPSSRIRLDAGDALVLYTDGLSEARNPRDEEYGPERLTRLLQGAHGQSPEGVTSTCLSDLEAFLAGAPKADDVTLMVVRRAV
jgi:phosphoserine phosphatase RsbU/P